MGEAFQCFENKNERVFAEWPHRMGRHIKDYKLIDNYEKGRKISKFLKTK